MLSFPDDLVIARLRGIAAIKLIGLSPDLAEAARKTPATAPALYMATATTGGPSEFSGSNVQGDRRTMLQFVLWISNHGTAEQVLATRRGITDAIDARFLDWTPDDGIEPLYQEQMRDQFVHGSWLVTQLFYRANWIYSGTSQP